MTATESSTSYAAGCQLHLYQRMGFPLASNDGTDYSKTGVNSAFLNGVLRCRTNDSRIQQIVPEVIEQYKTWGLPHSWWVEKSEAPPSLGALLMQQGLTHVGDFPVMVLNLKDYKPPQVDPTITVIVVENDEQYDAFGNILSLAFNISQPALAVFEKQMREAGNAKTFTNVLAFQNGKPVATGSITCTEEGAYIGNACLQPGLPDAGYGIAIAAKLLEEVQKLGCQRVAVISEPGEIEDKRQLGFEEAATMQIYATGS